MRWVTIHQSFSHTVKGARVWLSFHLSTTDFIFLLPMAISILITSFLVLLCLLSGEEKDSLGDRKNPIGNYINSTLYYLSTRIPLVGEITLSLPYYDEEQILRYRKVAGWTIGGWLRSLVGCIFCLSTWITIFVFLPFTSFEPLKIILLILGSYMFFKIFKILVAKISEN